MDGQIPLAAGGLRVSGEAGAPTARAPGRHVVPNVPAGGALLRAMDAALWTRHLARLGAGHKDLFLLDYLPPEGQGCSHRGPFSACRATGKGQEVGARAAWHRRRRWPCVHNTGSRPVPPVCSRAPNIAASGLTKGTAWTRRRCASRR